MLVEFLWAFYMIDIYSLHQLEISESLVHYSTLDASHLSP